jgi:hypothetical protein
VVENASGDVVNVLSVRPLTKAADHFPSRVHVEVQRIAVDVVRRPLEYAARYVAARRTEQPGPPPERN